MEIILLGLVSALLTGCIALIDSLLNNVLEICLYAEKYMTSTGGGSRFTVR